MICNLFESHTLFFMKLNIFNVFLTLFAITELIHRFFFTVLLKRGWENVRSGTCYRGNVQSGKSLSGKCPVGEVSVEELSFGEV